MWSCLVCWHRHIKPKKNAKPISKLGPGYVLCDTKPSACAACGRRRAGVVEAIHLFDSLIEAAYAAEVDAWARKGLVRDVQYHPMFTVPCEPVSAAGGPGLITYRADGAYTFVEAGARVVYDVKPRNLTTYGGAFELRRRIIETAHGIKIQVVKR